MARYDAIHCALCGSLPKLQTKRSGYDPLKFVYRFVCDASTCSGHHGQWYIVQGQAARIWNISNRAKSSTVKRYLKTVALQRSQSRV